jgi:hypothetical protein
MRTILLALVLVVGCHSSSLPGDGDGGGGSGGGAGSGGTGGGGGTKACAVLCTMGFTCCDGACVNLRNDIRNCGSCGVKCLAPDDYCDGQKCAPPPCSPACTSGTLCCSVQTAGPTQGPMCFAPTDGGTCPPGCPLCL